MNAIVRPVRRVAGTVSVPGDKSVSHRAALLGAVASGVTEVHGLLEGEDCLGTLRAVGALGAEVTRKGPGHYLVRGVGLDGLTEPDDVIDCGNSGTAVRLLLQQLVRARVPDLHRPRAVLPGGDLALEARVGERVILGAHGEAPLARHGWEAARERPAGEHAAALEPQVVVQAAGGVALNDEHEPRPRVAPGNAC